MRQILEKPLNAVYSQWLEDIELNTIPLNAFKDWLQETHGFTYTGLTWESLVVDIIDEQKYALFLLRWS